MGRARALGWLRGWTLDWVGWSSLCLSSPARGFKQTYTKAVFSYKNLNSKKKFRHLET